MESQLNELDTLMRIARQCGVSADALIEWIREQLVMPGDQQWGDEAIETVRRIRRLTTLGVNTAGVQMILYMRQQLIQHQAEITRIQQEMYELRQLHEQEIARLMRQFASDL
jgi:DNA-binding transcriptional MerR regulator